LTPLALTFLPLADSAILVVAREKGFAADAGIALDLVRSTSWATARDRLVYRQVQGAHLLAPLAVAVPLGLSQHEVALAAPFKLNANGNAITMSTAFSAALDPDPARRIGDPVAAAHDFAAAIGLHRRKPVVGVVHRFSSHALMLRYWLAHAGVDPDRDIVLRVLPPSLMVEALRAGEVDGFSVGEPWNSVAVGEGLGEIVATGARIWRRGVDKVLAFREDWLEANPDTVDRLLVALARAGDWCDQPANRDELAALLARPGYVGQPAAHFVPALAGRIVPRLGIPAIDIPDFVLFGREATGFPWRSQAAWIYSQLVRWRFVEAGADAERRAIGTFRSDVYRRALSAAGLPMPGASMKLEGALQSPLAIGTHGGGITLGPDRFFDGMVFDPEDVAGYIRALRGPAM
jgi:NitT/TauT family transport system ATP-binding protein